MGASGHQEQMEKDCLLPQIEKAQSFLFQKINVTAKMATHVFLI